MSHSILAPSSAGVWGAYNACPGSVLMGLQFPQLDSEQSAEGDSAHSLAALMVAEHKPGIIKPHLHDNVEMFEAARMYADDIQSTMRKTQVFIGNCIGIEKQIRIHDIHPECFGTPDCFLFDRRNMKLYVWDFKYGFGIVEVFENWQLIAYTAGIFEYLGDTFGRDVLKAESEGRPLDIQMNIVQPRGFHKDGPVRRWETNNVELIPYAEQLHTAALEALGTDPQTRTGKHCRYCTGRHGCAPLQRAALDTIQYIGEPLPAELDHDALGTELQILKAGEKSIKYRLSGLEEQASSIIRAGGNVPGLRVEQTKGKLTWNRPHSEVTQLGQLFDMDLDKPTNVTPTQAMAAGIPKEIIDQFADKPNRGIKLVEDDGSEAKRIFGAKHE